MKPPHEQPMHCFCCERPVSLTYHIQLRTIVAAPPGGFTSPTDPAYMRYTETMTYRSAFVCPACYAVLDSVDGTGEIGGQEYGIAGRSRGRKAALYNRAKYDVFRRRMAAKLGIDLT